MILAVLSYLDIFPFSDGIKKSVWSIVCLITAFIAGLRLETRDYAHYISLFESTPPLLEWFWSDISWIQDSRVEIGYLVLNGFLRCFDFPYISVFLFMAFLALALYYKALPKYTVYPFASFLVYIATVYPYKELVQIRHGVAIALCFAAIEYIKNRNLTKFLLLWLSAVFFHQGVGIFIFLYPLCRIGWNYKWMIGILAVSIGLMHVSWVDAVMGQILQNVSNERLLTLYTHPDAFVEIGYSKLAAYLLLLLVSLGLRKKLSPQYPYYDIACIMLLFGICLSASLHEFRELAERLSVSFYTGAFILVPIVAFNSLPRSLRPVGLLAIWVFCSVMLVQVVAVLT